MALSVRHFHYQTLRWYSGQQIQVHYSEPGTHSAKDFHDHDFTEIGIVTSGEAQHLVNGKSHPVKKGDILLLPPDTIHTYDHAGTLELYNIIYCTERISIPIFEGTELPLFRRFFSTESGQHHPFFPVVSLEEDELNGVIAQVRRLQDEIQNRQPGWQLASYALFLELITLLVRHSARRNPERYAQFQISEAISCINRNYARKITLEELAGITRMSVRNFTRHFREYTGCSPAGYLQELRLRRAAMLLETTNAGVTEIALRCGFCDGNYFCRLFREKRGITPRRYRLSRRDGAEN